MKGEGGEGEEREKVERELRGKERERKGMGANETKEGRWTSVIDKKADRRLR